MIFSKYICTLYTTYLLTILYNTTNASTYGLYGCVLHHCVSKTWSHPYNNTYLVDIFWSQINSWLRCIFLDRGNHQSCWNRNYIYPLTYFDAIQECTKMHSGWIGFQKWQQAFWFLWTIFFFFLIIGFFLLNCETLYQFNFEMDWRATKGCCCWFHNHTFDGKKFFQKVAQ